MGWWIVKADCKNSNRKDTTNFLTLIFVYLLISIPGSYPICNHESPAILLAISL